MGSGRQPHGFFERRLPDGSSVNDNERSRPIRGDGKLGEARFDLGNLALDLRATAFGYGRAAFAQVFRERFDGFERTAERQLAKSDVVQDREVGTLLVRSFELDEGRVVGARFHQAETSLVVNARFVARSGIAMGGRSVENGEQQDEDGAAGSHEA